MTSTTPNLGLTLYAAGDTTELFSSFRVSLAGNTSNMTLIDTAYGNMATLIDDTKGAFYIALSGTNTYTATEALAVYQTGLSVIVSVTNANTTASTLNISSQGAKALTKISAGAVTALESGDLQTGQKYLFVYDGTQFIAVGTIFMDGLANLISIAGAATPNNTDEFGVNVAGVLKKISLTNLKANLKTYFDTLYVTAAKGVTNGDSHDHLGGDGATIQFSSIGGTPPSFPSGHMVNGQLNVTVASNNITVAIKTLAGTNPSSTDVVYCRIGNTVRSITAALSVTKNAGTNWCNSGRAQLATKEVDYFAYLGYNATDGVTIGFSRIPYASQYSDFDTTTTGDKYCAISTITNAVSTDYYENIGRFAAILSAGAGYTWSVPTFTASTLINRPVFQTRNLEFTATITYGGGTTDPTSNTINVAKYFINGRAINIYLESVLVIGSGNRGVTNFGTPFDTASYVAVTVPCMGVSSTITGSLSAYCPTYLSVGLITFFVTMVSDGYYYATVVTSL